jgi:hypothetical protein
MVRRQNQHFIHPIEQEIAYRAVQFGTNAGLLKIAKFVDGVEEDNYPVTGTEEKLTFGGFFSKATFTVFVEGGFDKDSSHPFAMGFIGEDGFEHFVPSNSEDRFHIGETEVFYNSENVSWCCVERNPHYYTNTHFLTDCYFDDLCPDFML